MKRVVLASVLGRACTPGASLSTLFFSPERVCSTDNPNRFLKPSWQVSRPKLFRNELRLNFFFFKTSWQVSRPKLFRNEVSWLVGQVSRLTFFSNELVSCGSEQTAWRSNPDCVLSLRSLSACGCLFSFAQVPACTRIMAESSKVLGKAMLTPRGPAGDVVAAASAHTAAGAKARRSAHPTSRPCGRRSERTRTPRSGRFLVGHFQSLRLRVLERLGSVCRVHLTLCG